jgi:hypothetical protein
MDFTINTIRDAIGFGARSNKFFCQFPSIGDNLENEMTYFMTSVDCPEKSIGELVINWQGHTFKVPGDATVAPITATFQVDQNMKSYNYIDLWLKLVFDTHTNSRGLLDEIQKNLTINQLGPNNEIVGKWVIQKMFPTNIGPISFDKDSVDTVGQFTVTFACNDYEFVSVGTV